MLATRAKHVSADVRYMNMKKRQSISTGVFLVYGLCLVITGLHALSTSHWSLSSMNWVEKLLPVLGIVAIASALILALRPLVLVAACCQIVVYMLMLPLTIGFAFMADTMDSPLNRIIPWLAIQFLPPALVVGTWIWSRRAKEIEPKDRQLSSEAAPNASPDEVSS